MISVIIPNYNGAKFLREAIDSALDQQGVEVEVWRRSVLEIVNFKIGLEGVLR